MVLRRIATMGAALLVAGALAIGAAPPASAHTSSGGNRSLASVLAKDGSGFDRNWNDFDIVDNAVRAVLKAKPNSPVKVLADGKKPVTAFLPTDRAFRILVKDLTGTSYRSEKQVFTAVAGLGIDTVETVLLYHVVPGATITYKQALRSNGAALTMASGGSVTVKVRSRVFLKLVDADPDDANPYVVKANINKGNKQIAHGIDRVLRPINL
ncbi:MAG TPA: fasciclin domain-containing protein [Microlunatus sp.]